MNKVFKQNSILHYKLCLIEENVQIAALFFIYYKTKQTFSFKFGL